MRRLGWVLVWALAGCQDVAVEGGQCQEDSACGEGKLCLYDLDRATTYCTNTCGKDADCDPHQICRAGSSGISTDRVCVDRLRACTEVEVCNGLDDDCDGVVDEDGCEVIDGCVDDRSCGNFVCQPTEGQPQNLCAPPNPTATGEDFEPCSSGAECRNGVCETGLCSPLCRPSDLSLCPADFQLPDGRAQPMACMRAVGAANRPRYNACQLLCNETRNCRAGQECVWRTVVDSLIVEDHAWVCSTLDPARKPLGAACTNNDSEQGDDECQHGLCYKRTCTRICGGPGTSCADVGPDARCAILDLNYAPRSFSAFICDPRP